MSWFKKDTTPMSTEIESGTSVIRRALTARNRGTNLAGMCRDLGIATPAVEAFITSNAKLTPEILVKLAAYIWADHLKYDPVDDVIRPAKTQPATTIADMRRPPVINAPPRGPVLPGRLVSTALPPQPKKQEWIKR